MTNPHARVRRDRRIASIYALVQAALPLAADALALPLPALVYRNRRALLGALDLTVASATAVQPAECRSPDSSRGFVFAHARGLPTLLVTHDAADALAAGGRVLRLPGGCIKPDSDSIAPCTPSKESASIVGTRNVECTELPLLEVR